MNGDELLILKDSATLEELRAFFVENDFSTLVSRYDPCDASSEENKAYKEMKRYFERIWNEEMGELTGKKSLADYSDNHPVRCLEKQNEVLISGTEMELLANEKDAITVMEFILQHRKDRLFDQVKKYTEEHNKTFEELTEKDRISIMAKHFDELMHTIMRHMLLAQNVPEIMDVSKAMPTEEDFSNINSFDKKNALRKLFHTDTKIGRMLSLDSLIEDLIYNEHQQPVTVSAEQREQSDEKYEQLLQAFCKCQKNEIIFFLSYEEVMKYMPTAEERCALNPVNYVLTGNGHWYLRTSGKVGGGASIMIVESNGSIDTTDGISGQSGVRPAMWIEISGE